LLEAMREDVITGEQFKQLESLIASDENACQLYVDYMQFCSDLHYFQYAQMPVIESDTHSISESEKRDPDGRSAILDYTVWQKLAEAEKMAIGIKLESKKEPQQEIVKMIKPAPHKRQVSRFYMYLAACSTAAMLLIFALVIFTPPSGQILATLTDSIDAELISNNGQLENGDSLRQGSLTLSKGLVEIEFTDGGIVTIEGPAEIELESSSSMYLGYGKLSARVSEYATGFTVRTASSTIVDLGTEFGVNVTQDGSCELHMFTGKATLVTGTKDQKKTSQLITSKQARNIDGPTGQVSNIRLLEDQFVRLIDSQSDYVWRGSGLDLADIAIGGDGYGTGNTSMGIDPISGTLQQEAWQAGNKQVSGFVRLDSVAGVDGVFVPDGGNEPIQVSSAGHEFDQFGNTFGKFFKMIFHSNARHKGVPIRTVVLDGIPMNDRTNPSLVLHANIGITFDLEAIRSTIPGLDLAGFEGSCGIDDDAQSPAKADFRVLVDGTERFKSEDAMPGYGSRNINILLSETDHFLTLVVSDADGSINGDWGIFANPVLKLKTTLR